MIMPGNRFAMRMYSFFISPNGVCLDRLDVARLRNIKLWQGRPAVSKPPGSTLRTPNTARTKPCLSAQGRHVWLKTTRL